MIGFVIAMQSEAEILDDILAVNQSVTVFGKQIKIGAVSGKPCMLCVCGVGKVNAALGTAAVLALGAKTVFNFGVAGGLKEERTALAGVYLIEKAVQYDFDLTQLNGGKIGTLDEEKENYFPLFTPKADLPLRALASGDRFNDSPADHALLTDELHADIRDMEGAAIAQVCKSAGVPFLSVKAISDVYGNGSTTDQYQVNLKRAMQNLKARLAEILGAL